MSQERFIKPMQGSVGDATLTNLDLLNLIGEMRKELEHDRICGH